MRKWIFYLLFGFLFSTTVSYSFTFSASPVAATCAANGVINFNITNPTPGGTIEFIVYKLPNITTPQTTVTTNSITDLTPGTYKIVAKETVGTTSTTQEQTVIIRNNSIPLQYDFTILNEACSPTSTVIVNIKSGTAVNYEILSGPLIVPVQTSNTFTNLPIGVYTIRVFDNCGNGLVKTFTVTLNPLDLSVSNPILTSVTPPSCNSALATQTVTAAEGTMISYPLSVQYIIHPPSGADITYSLTLATGNPTAQDISQIIPTYINQNYTFDVVVTDNCGTNSTTTFTPNQNIGVNIKKLPAECGFYYITVSAANFTPPYTLNFNSSPAGFTPSAFNPLYPSSFTASSNDFGSETNHVPFGMYNVTITDACGRTANTQLEVIAEPPIPKASGASNGCNSNSGSIHISITNHDIITAVIISAPSDYPNTPPVDVTSFISGGVLDINPVPIGSYTIVITDDCNDPFDPIVVIVPNANNGGLTKVIRPGCDLQLSSISITSKNGALTSVIITSAPAGFAVPFDASSNITGSGKFYMNNLIDGNYTFTCLDTCGVTNTLTTPIAGFNVTASNYPMQINCGSFDIPLQVASNATSPTYWLQKKLTTSPVTWGNPFTNAPYTDGSLLTITNAKRLNNNATNYNFTMNGTFRIVVQFKSYNNGSEINTGIVTTTDKTCQYVLPNELTFNEHLEIVDVYRMPCSSSGNLDVIVLANGAPPLHYSIYDATNTTLVLDNGTSNTFPNLTPNTYYFRVKDNCNNVVSRSFNVANLASLVTVTQPNNLSTCQNTITNNETFDLTTQTATILGSQSPTDYTLKYYLSLADAQSGSNAISNLTTFNPTSNPQTIYVRLIYNQLPNCYKTTSFDLVVIQTPKLNVNQNYTSCSTAPIVINASLNNLPTTTYLWSTGETTPSISISQLGMTTLTVTATNSYGTTNCTLTKTITLNVSQPPKFDHIETTDWTANENTISIFTSNTGDFEYSLDGFTYQDENIFSNLIAGLYHVYIRDKNGCGVVEQEVWLLDYPRFFTPNGDGYNDTWFVKNSDKEPHFKVEILDRYGKFITAFYSNSEGWDGNYNGRPQFATDYWFIVYREDGRIHKGHFTLKR